MTPYLWTWFALGLFGLGLVVGICFGVMWGIRERAAKFVEGLEQAKAIYKRQLEEERLVHAREKELLVRHPPPFNVEQHLARMNAELVPEPPRYPCAHGMLPAPCKICAPWLQGIAGMPTAKQ